MFPSVRLMIVAMSASLLAVVCGMTLFMGLFAAFSIAHEPFSALPTGKPPLQLALEEASTPSDVRPAPFGTRFQVKPAPGSGAKITPVAPDHGPALQSPPQPGSRADTTAALDRQTEPVPPSPKPDAPQSATPETTPRAAPPVTLNAIPETAPSAALEATQGATPEVTRNAAPEATQSAPRTEQDPPPETTRIPAKATSTDVGTDALAADDVPQAGGAKVEAGKGGAPGAIAASSPPAMPPSAPASGLEAVQNIQNIQRDEQIARQADNPASTSTAPPKPRAEASRKVKTPRRVAIKPRPARKPRARPLQLVTNPNSGLMEPGLLQPNVNAYVQPNLYVQPNNFTQPTFQSTPTARNATAKPRVGKVRRTTKAASPDATIR